MIKTDGSSTRAQCPVSQSSAPAGFSVASPPPAAAGQRAKAYWQYPLPTGSVANRYISGPLPDGSGDQEAIIQMDPCFTPWAPPFVMKQVPQTVAGTVEGRMQQYPHPRLLGWFGNNPQDSMDLGGTVTIYVGEEMEQHSFTVGTLVYIPPNTPHGVVVYGKDVAFPMMHVDTFPDRVKGEPRERPDLDLRLPDLARGFPVKSDNPPGGIPGWNPAGGGLYGQYFFSGKNPQSPVHLPPSQLILVPGDVPGLPPEKSFMFIYAWEDTRMSNVPMHVTHAHPFNENLIYFSTDPSQPHDLGATVTIYAFDTEIKKLVPVDMSKPFISSSARGKHLHCPVIRRNMQRKLGFIWYGVDYDPETFEKGLHMGVSMQYHNEHYTQGRFNLLEYGVRPEDLPDEPEGDGGFLTSIEPHTNWPINKGHDGVNAPLLTIKPKPRSARKGNPSVDPQPVAELLPAAREAAGVWNFESMTPRGPRRSTLTLRIEGNQLLGELADENDTVQILDGQISGTEMRWRYELTKPLKMNMRVEVKLQDDTLVGTLTLTGLGKLPFKATRVT